MKELWSCGVVELKVGLVSWFSFVSVCLEKKKKSLAFLGLSPYFLVSFLRYEHDDPYVYEGPLKKDIDKQSYRDKPGTGFQCLCLNFVPN